jgi:hypothetical protein
MQIGCGFYAAMVGALLTSLVAPREVVDAERVRPVPLGGALGGQVGDGSYGVYVPTRHGGTLTITASTGSVEALGGPDGRARTNSREVGGADAHGWYTFRISGTVPGVPYDAETASVQGRPGGEDALQLLLLAHQGRLEP